MAPTGTKTIIWANGENDFCISQTKHIFELEEKCNAGIAEILHRLEAGTWRLNDLRETIRLGLIGGGMEPIPAMAAIKRHVDGNPLTQSVFLAYEIVQAVLVGVPGEEIKKKQEAGEDQVLSETTAVSVGQQSSDSAPDLAGRRGKQKNARSGNLPQPSKDTIESTDQTTPIL